MLPSTTTFAFVLLVCAAVLQAEAFTTTTRKVGCSSALQADRRDFLNAAFSTIAVTSFPLIAGAEDLADDLAMPSEEEQRKAEADAAAERLRRKAELQKKNSNPTDFRDRLAKEREKQKNLQMSKEERRNALCEELGRGC
ncbi:unnamed protein product [Pseudo-nitzschia multistriata]|uniref:RxLR effector protein n=1 Tax=Pseudo-nitzschia multistriata TaxID=183589 RepID=A0A448Z5U6_9STRA|nr:unnamed protein product [Pseudo-nitzschia multistriata]